MKAPNDTVIDCNSHHNLIIKRVTVGRLIELTK